MPQRGQNLPAAVREALWLESNGVTPHLVRVHLGRLASSGVLPRKREITRHFRELALASWLSLWWTRDEMVDAYGAVVWMGGRRFGLEAGAQHFYGQHISELSPPRLGMLIAMVRSPGRFDPACHPERALDARNAFLARMSTASLLSASEVATAMAAPLGVTTACEERDNLGAG
jgi:penicillin-binding protein 1A